MVSYCCVKGCSNNSNHKKKDPSALISFHAFPCNLELKTKWLRAIGRPNWSPPSHARICSVHFSQDQINYEGCRIRIKDDAVPVNSLPPNSNFEASSVEACRICLATDLKLYSLQDSQLSTCMESITGFNENYSIEGLPQYVCYLCAASLIKCYKLVEKSMIAQATLLDIFAKNGQITKSLIELENRDKLNLKSSLNHYLLESYCSYKYDEENKMSSENCDTDIYFKNENVPENELPFEIKPETNKYEVEGKDNIDEECFDDSHLEIPIDDTISECDITESVKEPTNMAIVKTKRLRSKEKSVSKKLSRKKENGLTPDETEMQKHFDIVKLSFQEQIEEWKRNTVRRPLTSETIYECEICCKIFAHVNTYRVHVASHDPIRGKAECPICKLRFKTDVLLKSHINIRHAKKFYCKACPKVFNNVGVAKSHHRWHSGHTYSCAQCTFRSRHVSALGAHRRAAHARAHTCGACGRACVSRRGLVLHVATAHRDEKVGRVSSGVARSHHRWHSGHTYSCAQCTFRSRHVSALGAHRRAAHARAHTCGACGRACVSRRGLVLHVATAHRDEKAVNITGVFRCEACDINFASEGARRVHLLTSSQHKKKSDLCDPTTQPAELRNSCNKCGVECSSFSDLVTHTRTEHPRPGRKHWKTQYEYPTQCELCGETMISRRKHWQHVRQHHPKETNTYRPVVTAVCDTCGKGFQNSTKLHLHQLRHSAPTVRCDSCPRLFYDKYALARHATTHKTSKPHQCRTCGKAFRLRSNLARHSRVHTDIATYECSMCGKKFKHSTSVNLHIRTVHYKLPHPPRKKRNKPIKDSVANDM
ncbi:uncharacterized protein LOC142979246 [Anticarsia gemmatalis]|uniref:uncharacterized protein LOC142979246 n=1 Tax=Anticarsia gemmatalis TaxID=129554 RepID=UPI003F76C642